MNPAAKRYMRWFLFWMGVYSVLTIAGGVAHNRFGVEGGLALVFALSPVLASLMALREFVIFLRAADEVQARIQLEAILWGAGIVAFASFAWGFIEVRMEAPDLSFIWILPAMVAVWGLALPLVSRRYR